jgi:L-ascorbate metabolism protein UlaG (beta-lactamase superfamily)
MATSRALTEIPRAESACTITWLGHATALIDLDGIRILTDPLLRRHMGPLVSDGPRLPEDILQSVDAVLISHLHADHADPRSLRLVADDALVVGPYGTGHWLRAKGLSNVRELRMNEQVEIGPVVVEPTAARHESRRHRFAAHHDAMGFLVGGGHTIYFAGDTDIFDSMAELRGRVNAALMPVGGWGHSLGDGHLDATRAAEAVALIEPQVAIPIHWGSLHLPGPLKRISAFGEAGWTFERETRRVAPQVEVRVLVPGGQTTVR